jgi:hypothetical protein
MYKIRIGCTEENDLSFCGEKINMKGYTSIVSELTKNDYIEIIQVLYKKHKKNNFTTKTIEFFINRELDEIEYILFIAKMKDAEFRSEKNINIQLINTDQNKIIFDYKFTSMCKNKIIMSEKRKNNSIYKTQQIYKK